MRRRVDSNLAAPKSSWVRAILGQTSEFNECFTSMKVGPIIVRSLTIWLVLMVAEIVHGILRAIALVPMVGEFRSNQIGMFTGSAIILAIACFTIRWIGVDRTNELLLVGSIWLVLTVALEVLFGRFVAGLSLERIASDYNALNGWRRIAPIWEESNSKLRLLSSSCHWAGDILRGMASSNGSGFKIGEHGGNRGWKTRGGSSLRETFHPRSVKNTSPSAIVSGRSVLTQHPATW